LRESFSTAFARLTCAAIDGVSGLELSRGAMCVVIIAQGGAAVEDAAHAADEGLHGGKGEVVGEGGGVDSAGEQQFIDVDIAESRDEVLIEQGGFDGPVGLVEAGV